jgi:hypothetical protein
MPLEVRQIGIRMSVGEERGGRSAGPVQSGCGARIPPAERNAIVEECLAAVLAALKAEAER